MTNLTETGGADFTVSFPLVAFARDDISAKNVQEFEICNRLGEKWSGGEGFLFVVDISEHISVRYEMANC